MRHIARYLHNAGQLRQTSTAVQAGIHQLLSLHIIGHLPLEIDAALAVASSSKVLGAASNECDCQAASKQGQRALLPEAVDERNDPAAAL